MAEVRCNGCRQWFDAHNRECPECEHKRPAYNSWLVVAKMNNNLNWHKERAIANR